MFPSAGASGVAITPLATASEEFKPRHDEDCGMRDMIGESSEEELAPAVVIATIALLGVFVIGFLYQIVGLLA